MPDFSMMGLILTCLKILVASVVIGITIFVVLLIAMFIWSVLKSIVNLMKD